MRKIEKMKNLRFWGSRLTEQKEEKERWILQRGDDSGYTHSTSVSPLPLKNLYQKAIKFT